jgi:hypothetical protein
MKYKITLDKWGGEYCVGTIPRETIKYWSERDEDELKEHLVSDSIPDVPAKHCIYPFYEQDSLIHTCGVELSPYNRLTVSNVDTDEDVFGCNLDEDWIKDNGWVINDDEPDLDYATGVIHTVSVEKGYWEYEVITTDKVFDQKKLEFFMYAIDGLYVIHYMKYEGVELEHIDGTTVGKDFNVWFD